MRLSLQVRLTKKEKLLSQILHSRQFRSFSSKHRDLNTQPTYKFRDKSQRSRDEKSRSLIEYFPSFPYIRFAARWLLSTSGLINLSFNRVNNYRYMQQSLFSTSWIDSFITNPIYTRRSKIYFLFLRLYENVVIFIRS